MSVPDPISERKIVGVFPEGRSCTIHLMVGKPRRLPDGDWECPVAADGLHSSLKAMRGVDSWQALNLGVRLLESLLTAEEERGTVFYWSPGEEATTVAELFSRTHYEDDE